MTYTYGLRGAPAVGGGLPGLPQRKNGGGLTSGGATPVDTQFGYADEQPANAVEVGAIVEREDYPALSELIPHTFEQTVQLPIALPGYAAANTPVVALNEDGSRIAVLSAGAGVSASVWRRSGDSFSQIYTSTSGTIAQSMSSAVFSRDSQYLYVAYSGNTAAPGGITPLKYTGSTYSPIASIGGANWPVKLLAVSPDGTLLAAASSTTTSGTERVKLWRRSGDTFTAVALPGVYTSATIDSLCFTNDGLALVYTISNATGSSAVLGWRVDGVSATALTPMGVSHRRTFLAPVGDSDLLAWNVRDSGTSAILVISCDPAVGFSNKYVVSNSVPEQTVGTIYGSPITVVDNGSRAFVGLHSVRIQAGKFVLDNSAESLIFSGALSRSLSSDSKFLALGLSASPWLRVYGSESKMVARLNERSPAGQKLYMKAG